MIYQFLQATQHKQREAARALVLARFAAGVHGVYMNNQVNVLS